MLTEDLLMLLHHPETGHLLVSSDKVDAALGGALLVELTERERIKVTEPHRVTRNRTVAVIDPRRGAATHPGSPPHTRTGRGLQGDGGSSTRTALCWSNAPSNRTPSAAATR